MTITMTYERIIPLYKRLYGRGIGANTASRWCRHGVRGKTLRHIFLSGAAHTTEEWLRAFLEGEALQPKHEVEVKKPRSNKARQAAIERAVAECEAAGV